MSFKKFIYVCSCGNEVEREPPPKFCINCGGPAWEKKEVDGTYRIGELQDGYKCPNGHHWLEWGEYCPECGKKLFLYKFFRVSQNGRHKKEVWLG